MPITTDDLLPYSDTVLPQEAYAYQHKVSSLLYTTIIIWLDVTYIVAKLLELLQNLSLCHSVTTDYTITYLNRIKNLAIEYSDTANHSQVFTCANDAAFADDTTTRHSTEDYLFQLFSEAIDWHSTKQKTVMTFSTETELLTLIHATKKTLWWK